MVDSAFLRAAQKRRRRTKDAGRRRGAVETAAAIWRGRAGEVTLEQLGAELLGLRLYPPRGGKTWALASVKGLLDRGRPSREKKDIGRWSWSGRLTLRRFLKINGKAARGAAGR